MYSSTSWRIAEQKPRRSLDDVEPSEMIVEDVPRTNRVGLLGERRTSSCSDRGCGPGRNPPFRRRRHELDELRHVQVVVRPSTVEQDVVTSTSTSGPPLRVAQNATSYRDRSSVLAMSTATLSAPPAARESVTIRQRVRRDGNSMAKVASTAMVEPTSSFHVCVHVS